MFGRAGWDLRRGGNEYGVRWDGRSAGSRGFGASMGWN